MGRKTVLVIFIAVLAFGPECANGDSLPSVMLPSGIMVAIETPSAAIPAAYSSFVGKWGGFWNGTLPSNLIVESVTESGEARVVYAWGTDKYVRSPGGARLMATISGGVLSWGPTANGIMFRFKLRSDGKLDGERSDKGQPGGVVTMSKM
jgi:hypothetical protein